MFPEKSIKMIIYFSICFDLILSKNIFLRKILFKNQQNTTQAYNYLHNIHNLLQMKAIDTLYSFKISIYYLISTPYIMRTNIIDYMDISHVDINNSKQL